MKELWDLYATFFRVGGLTFGGGYAMLPMLQKEVVENKKWATEAEIMDYFAIGQCTPGIIAVNTATFIGYKTRGLAGAIAATAGIVSPSIVVISIIAACLKNFYEYPAVLHALAAVRVVVGVLVMNAVIKMWRTAVKTTVGGIMAIGALAACILLDPSPVLVVIAGAAIGLILPEKALKGGK